MSIDTDNPMTGRRRKTPVDRLRPALIVSADPDTMDLYVLAIRSERTAILSVTSVDQAVQLVRDGSVSVVVLDVTNPATDWDACRQLVAIGSVPVVVLTGWIDEDARHEALAIGCAAFVAKPASPLRLRDVLHRARAGERGIVEVD